MVIDPISDMFHRINNAVRIRKPVVLIPYSKMKMEIAKLLETRGFAGEAVRRGKKNNRNIEMILIYDENGSGKITKIERVSKPSRRIYQGWRELRSIKGGLGFYLISTPAGIMDDKQARKSKVGGEILGKAW